jgi:hypothetical protein
MIARPVGRVHRSLVNRRTYTSTREHAGYLTNVKCPSFLYPPARRPGSSVNVYIVCLFMNLMTLSVREPNFLKHKPSRVGST